MRRRHQNGRPRPHRRIHQPEPIRRRQRRPLHRKLEVRRAGRGSSSASGFAPQEKRLNAFENWAASERTLFDLTRRHSPEQYFRFSAEANHRPYFSHDFDQPIVRDGLDTIAVDPDHGS